MPNVNFNINDLLGGRTPEEMLPDLVPILRLAGVNPEELMTGGASAPQQTLDFLLNQANLIGAGQGGQSTGWGGRGNSDLNAYGGQTMGGGAGQNPLLPDLTGLHPSPTEPGPPDLTGLSPSPSSELFNPRVGSPAALDPLRALGNVGGDNLIPGGLPGGLDMNPRVGSPAALDPLRALGNVGGDNLIPGGLPSGIDLNPRAGSPAALDPQRLLGNVSGNTLIPGGTGNVNLAPTGTGGTPLGTYLDLTRQPAAQGSSSLLPSASSLDPNLAAYTDLTRQPPRVPINENTTAELEPIIRNDPAFQEALSAYTGLTRQPPRVAPPGVPEMGPDLAAYTDLTRQPPRVAPPGAPEPDSGLAAYTEAMKKPALTPEEKQRRILESWNQNKDRFLGQGPIYIPNEPYPEGLPEFGSLDEFSRWADQYVSGKPTVPNGTPPVRPSDRRRIGIDSGGGGDEIPVDTGSGDTGTEHTTVSVNPNPPPDEHTTVSVNPNPPPDERTDVDVTPVRPGEGPGSTPYIPNPPQEQYPPLTLGDIPPQTTEDIVFQAPDNPFGSDLYQGFQSILDMLAGRTDVPYLADLQAAQDIGQAQEMSDLRASLARRGVDVSTIADEALARLGAQQRGEDSALAMNALNQVLQPMMGVYSGMTSQQGDIRNQALNEFMQMQNLQGQSDQAYQAQQNQALSMLLNALGISTTQGQMPGFNVGQPSEVGFWESLGNIGGNLGPLAFLAFL